ncbi:hypothetical protein FIBSPDRAFT_503519 [Athelia psychrophila]|uniref:Uncharacterized protein n=1 Tax=Athelia psychrophila TaxID=1759441 RepID=A0A166K5V6_9AGAM|nr:hypothetical protein FIBSPDRAFT_503519 [Fibularhizoctonia sp. CBS 109695]
MNRILQQNGASPPWVDVQGGSDLLPRDNPPILDPPRPSTLTLSRPLYTFSDFTLAQARALRDPEREARERRYHDLALEPKLASAEVQRPRAVRGPAPVASARGRAGEHIRRRRGGHRARHRGAGGQGAGAVLAEGRWRWWAVLTSEPGQRRAGSGGPGGSEADVSASASPSPAWRIRDVVRGWLSRWTSRSWRRL